jgi:hypothetical protein
MRFECRVSTIELSSILACYVVTGKEGAGEVAGESKPDFERGNGPREQFLAN